MRQEEVKGEDLEDDEQRLIVTGALPPFWKPEVIGEEREGEVIKVRTLEKGDVVHLQTLEDAVISVPVSVTMAEIDFRAMIGQRLRFRFLGTADTKTGNKVKLFRISVLKKKDDDEVPF